MTKKKDPTVGDMVKSATTAAAGYVAVLAEMTAKTEALEVVDLKSETLAKKGIQWARSEKKRIDETRKKINRPAKEVIDTSNGHFMPQIKMCDAIIAILTTKLRNYDKLLEANAPKSTETYVALPPERAEVAGMVEPKRWTAEVVDLDAVPMEWCDKVPDMKLLRAHAVATNGADVPGVKFERVKDYRGGRG